MMQINNIHRFDLQKGQLSLTSSSRKKPLDKKWINKLIAYLVFLVQYKRKQIYLVTALLIILGVIGIMNVKTTGNLTDDLPKNQELYQDLKILDFNFFHDKSYI